MEYIQIDFQNITSEQTDLLIAELTMIGVEGFEEGENSLKAFIPLSDFIEAHLKEVTDKNKCSFTLSVIKETNWNAVWESNFQPVIVDDFAGIRADFHEPMKEVEHEIIITPKMSFGTGHHATTFMMLQQMRKIDFKDKTVFDFGTGTGVLAIMAEKLGAAGITAVDNDKWSIENATENIERNKCNSIRVIKADTALLNEQFDIILANINKNVILDNLSILKEQLKPNGVLLLSGLLSNDQNDIIESATNLSLQLIDKQEKNNWISLRLLH